MLTCTTVSCIGHLEWWNSSGYRFVFDHTAMVGNTGELGDFSLNLTHKEAYQTEQCNLNGMEQMSTEQCNLTVVYISTATLNSAVEETTISCTDGFNLHSETVKIRSEFSTIQLVHLLESIHRSANQINVFSFHL